MTMLLIIPMKEGGFFINAIWKSKIAVLVGDYLLARGLLLAVKNKEYEILGIFADAVKEMSEGELMQIKNSRKLKITESEYFEIIRKKTATLISCCSSCGAKSVGVPDESVTRMKHFGELLGIAFQIKDDLLDYQVNSLTGKPIGNDIQEKKLTLPLIHALETSQNAEKHNILKLMGNDDKSIRKFNEVLTFIQQNDGFSYAEAKMNEYARKALDELVYFSNVEIRQALEDFVFFTIHRNK